MKDSRQVLGAAAEQQALAYLEQRGLCLLAKNWRCRQGELDLVMREADTVVFVEVRYRRHTAWGSAQESVDSRKQQRLIRAAQAFLQSAPVWAEHPCRFDVIAIRPEDVGGGLDWIRNAFDS